MRIPTTVLEWIIHEFLRDIMYRYINIYSDYVMHGYLCRRNPLPWYMDTVYGTLLGIQPNKFGGGSGMRVPVKKNQSE